MVDTLKHKMVEVPILNACPEVQAWADTFYEQEAKYMWHKVTQYVTLEVEVEYDEIESGRVIKDATCQNVDPPNFVKAWAEGEAKRLVKEGKT